MKKTPAILMFMWILGGLSLVHSDEIVLKNGLTLEGAVREEGTRIIVDVGYGTIVLNRSEIRSIGKSEETNDEFDRRLQAVRPDDPNGFLELAQWARLHGLTSRSVGLLRKVLAMDPESDRAHRLLGYVRFKDTWLTQDEYKAALGLVRYQGEWITADAAERMHKIDQELSLASLKQSGEDQQSEQQVMLERERLALKERYIDYFMTTTVGMPWGIRYWGPAIATGQPPAAQ